MTTEETPHPSNSASPSVIRRHPLAFGIPAGVIATVLVAGLTAWGVTALVENAGTPTAAVAPAGSARIAGTPAPAGKTGGLRGVRGTITAMNGSSWTIRTLAGTEVTIAITPTTAYGTKKAPSAESDFAVGDAVAVIGVRQGNTGTATRVIRTRVLGAKDGAGNSPTPSASPNS
jgi:hypothetical protein